MSQALTLFTTPVVYLYFDRLQHWWERVRGVTPSPLETIGSEEA
jgi:multidrug efflux pump